MIIPTYRAGDDLQKLLDSLGRQELQPVETIVIDSGSPADTLKMAESCGSRVVSIKPGAFDHGGTRNLAAGKAKGSILVFMTQDALPVDDQLLKKLVDPLRDKKNIVSYARQLADDNAPLSEKYLRLTNYPPRSARKTAEQIETDGIRTFQCSNVCAAYRSKEFKNLGCFPTPVVCNEDMLFAAKAIFAGYAVVYNAEAVVWHTHHYNCPDLFRRYFDIAASLDHNRHIRSVGKVEASGKIFLMNQLRYIREQRKYYQLIKVFPEALAKYLGFKTGENHTCLPRKLKKYLGLNRGYWSKME